MKRLGVSVVLASFLGIAHADPPSTADQQRAAELFEEGRKLLDADQPAEACAKFDAAIRLDATAAGTMLNLGLCNEKLKKYKTALYWFRKAQSRASETNLPSHERAAKEHTATLAAMVATVKITLADPAPAEARVKIDGEEIKPDDYGHAEVDPGHHVLDAGAPGKKNVHQEFDIEGRGGQTLTIAFVDGDNSIVVDRGATRRHIALGLGIAGLATWAFDGWLLYHEKQIYNANYDPATMMAPPGRDATKADHARTVAEWYVTSISVLAGAAVATGAILYFTAPQKERIDQTVFAPVVGPDQVGVAAMGRF